MSRADQREARPARLAVVALVSLGLVARLAPALMMAPDGTARLPGARAALALARSLADGRGFALTEEPEGRPGAPSESPTDGQPQSAAVPAVGPAGPGVRRAPMMPAYPLLLALAEGSADAPVRPALVVQAVCGAATMVLAAWMAYRLAGVWAAVVAAALLAFDPFQVLFTALVSPVTLAALALAAESAAGLVAVEAVRTGRRAWPWVVAAGLAQAAAAYVAVWTLALVPVAAAAALVSRHRKRLVAAWAVATAVVVVALAPWLVRHPVQGGAVGRETHRAEYLAGLAGAGAAQEGGAEPAEPTGIVAGAVGRAGRLWSPALAPGLEDGPLHPAAGYTSLVPAALLAVAGLWALRGRAEAWWLLGPAAAATLWHAAVGGWPGDRAAVLAPLAALAGAGLVAMLGKNGATTMSNKE